MFTTAWKVEYDGLLFQHVIRLFDSRERAEQWIRQCGLWGLFGPRPGVDLTPVLYLL